MIAPWEYYSHFGILFLHPIFLQLNVMSYVKFYRFSENWSVIANCNYLEKWNCVKQFYTILFLHAINCAYMQTWRKWNIHSKKYTLRWMESLFWIFCVHLYVEAFGVMGSGCGSKEVVDFMLILAQFTDKIILISLNIKCLF